MEDFAGVPPVAGYSKIPTEDEDEAGSNDSPRQLLRKPGHANTILSKMERRQSLRGDRNALEILRGEKSVEKHFDVEDVAAALEDDGSNSKSSERVRGSFLSSMWFQVFIGLAIIGNSVIIGFETDMPELECWEFVESAFLIIFLMELVLRLLIIGPRTYFDPESPDIVWNVFDLTIVGIGVLGTISSYLGMSSGQFATIFRMIRLMRIMRIFRIFRFLRQLYLLMVGFGVAAMATTWVTVLCVVLLYVCSIFMVKLTRMVDESNAAYDFLALRYRGVGAAMSTMFQLMLNPDLEPYKELMGTYIILTTFLVMFVIFGSFGMLALLTGVISEAMFSKNQARMEEERSLREEKRKVLSSVAADLFEEFVADNDSDSRVPEIAIADVEQFIPDMMNIFAKYGFVVTRYALEEVLEHADTDGSGSISKNEFVHAIISTSEGVSPTTILELHHDIQSNAAKTEKMMLELLDIIEEQDENNKGKMEKLMDNCKALETKVDLLMTRLEQEPQTPQSSRAAQAPNSPAQRKSGNQQQQQQQQQQTGVADPSTADMRLVSLDARRVLKLDACEAMVREMRHAVAELTTLTGQGQDFDPLFSGGKGADSGAESGVAGGLDQPRMNFSLEGLSTEQKRGPASPFVPLSSIISESVNRPSQRGPRPPAMGGQMMRSSMATELIPPEPPNPTGLLRG